jgi:imidazolonepropionase-like amidohydrolase
MFTLITGGTVYAPQKLGRRDILIAGTAIARIAEKIELPAEFQPLIIRARGKTIVPGFVDLHVHLLGGGGEAGPWSRTASSAWARGRSLRARSARTWARAASWKNAGSPTSATSCTRRTSLPGGPRQSARR